MEEEAEEWEVCRCSEEVVCWRCREEDDDLDGAVSSSYGAILSTPTDTDESENSSDEEEGLRRIWKYKVQKLEEEGEEENIKEVEEGAAREEKVPDEMAL